MKLARLLVAMATAASPIVFTAGAQTEMPQLLAAQSRLPEYPEQLKASNVEVIFTVRVNLRADGTVAGARTEGVQVKPSRDRAMDEQAIELTRAAVRASTSSLRFSAPADLPATVSITFDFHDGVVSTTSAGH